jgi:hypothetical protein
VPVRLTLLVGLLALGLTACNRPEAMRTRGGGPGADVGNRSPVVEMHQGAQPYFQTPCVTTLDTCTGPLPIFGIPRSDRG